MKRLLQIITMVFAVLLLLTAQVEAPWLMRDTGGAPPSDYCDNCTTNCDVECEDADGTETPTKDSCDGGNATELFSTATSSNWNQCADSDNSIDEDTHASATGCSEDGTYAIEISITGTDADEDAHIHQTISEVSTIYFSGYVRINSETLVNGEFASLITVYDDPSTVLSISISHQSGNLVFGMNYDNGAGWTSCYDTTNTLSTGVWYRIGGYWNSASNAEMYTDASGSWTKELEENVGVCSGTAGTEPVDKLIVGFIDAPTNVGSGHAIEVQLDMVGYDETSFPDPCS